jgi:hypothetical protein
MNAAHRSLLMTTPLALMAVLGAGSAAGAPKYSVSILPNIAIGVSIQGVAINNHGQVAGNVQDVYGLNYAVLWTGSTP